MKLFIICILFVTSKAFPQGEYSQNVSPGESESVKAITPNNCNEGNVQCDNNEINNLAANRDEENTKSSNTEVSDLPYSMNRITHEEESQRINNKKTETNEHSNLDQEDKLFLKQLVYVYETKINSNEPREDKFVMPFVEFKNALRSDNVHRINKRQVGGIGGLLNPPQSEVYATSNLQYAAALSSQNNNMYNNQYPYGYNTGGYVPYNRGYIMCSTMA